MKTLPLKTITILVCTALAAIFLYQAYWLYSLYVMQKQRQETYIAEAMRISDYNEMVARISKLAARKDAERHGSVSFAAGYSIDKHRQFKQAKVQTVISRMDSDEVVIHSEDWLDTLNIKRKRTGNRRNMHIEVKSTHTDEIPKAAVSANQSMFGTMIDGKEDANDLTMMMQQGIHSGLDMVQEPDVRVFDSLLTARLQGNGIYTKHRLEQLHFLKTINGIDSTKADTLNIISTGGYVPSRQARHYDYCYDNATHSIYRLWVEPMGFISICRQFKGILASSLATFIILVFAFWYLIHTLLRQKTLEEMKTDFTHNITHELKTPIAVAYAANDALLNFKQGADPETREKYLRISQEQLSKLGGMVEQILSASMERRKNFTLKKERIVVGDTLTPIIDMQRLKCGKLANICISVEPQGMTVFADRTQFCQMVDNLLDNAVKYSGDDATVKVSCRKNSDGNVCISVSDNGIGISEAQQKHIFEKFYRVPNGDRHEVRGYGLGLYYVATMMSLHGGNITVKSQLGKGSTFTLTFDDNNG